MGFFFWVGGGLIANWAIPALVIPALVGNNRQNSRDETLL